MLCSLIIFSKKAIEGLAVLMALPGPDVLGDVYHAGIVVHGSDSNLKRDLQRIDNALDRVDRLTGYTYTVVATEKRSTGLIAQEVQQVLPEAVEAHENSTLGVAYGNMMGLAMEAIKELRIEVEKIKASMGISQ